MVAHRGIAWLLLAACGHDRDCVVAIDEPVADDEETPAGTAQAFRQVRAAVHLAYDDGLVYGTVGWSRRTEREEGGYAFGTSRMLELGEPPWSEASAE